MTLGNKIAVLRKEQGLTQDGLAQKLGVTNQAVSKWESDACCPDIQLLPKLADILNTSLDALFDHPAPSVKSPLPWEDDGVLRVVLYVGAKLVAGHPARDKIEFCYEGPALDVHSELSVTCEDVEGNVTAGNSVTCGDVAGHVQAEGSITCDNVEGNVQAKGNVTCDSVEGSVTSGGSVICDCVSGDVRANTNVTCDSVEGNVEAKGNVTCDSVSGSVTAGGNVYMS